MSEGTRRHRPPAAGCTGVGVPSLQPDTTLGNTERPIWLCQGCVVQNPKPGRLSSRSRPSPQRAASQMGRFSEPLCEGSDRNQSGWWLCGGCRASPSIAGVSGAAGPRGREGRAGPGCSAAPHPSRQVLGCLILSPIAAKGPKPIFNQCETSPDGIGRRMGGACSGRAALCTGASETRGQRSRLLR